MTTKRIRCTCGRVYDPVKHAKCPECGTENVVASVSVPPPLPKPDPKKPPPLPAPSAPRPPISIQLPFPIDSRTLLLIGGGVFAFILLLLMVRGCGGKDKIVKRERSDSEPAAVPSATVRSGGTSGVVPRGETQVPDIGALIANAAAGATVTVPPGLYQGGLIAARPVRIVGDSKAGGEVVIQSEGKEGLSVRAPGVVVQNVSFISSGIGELPAISVADGADLQMEGCKIQSGSALGVAATGKAAIKATGSTFTANSGTAVRLNQQARGNFTQCSFSNAEVGLALANGATAELHSCAFENNGVNDSNGAIMMLEGAQTQVTADDCHFTNNAGGIMAEGNASLAITNSPFKNNGESRTGSFGLVAIRNAHASLTDVTFESNRFGVSVTEKGVLEMQKCNFDGTGYRQSRQVVAGSCPVTVIGEGSSATVRNTVIANSTPYGASVFSGGKIVLEDVEIYGSGSVGLVVGDRTGPLGHAEVKHCKFNRNVTGIGICAGGNAVIEDSEFRENNDGIVAIDKDSNLKLTKTMVAFNKDHGLYVYNNSEATVLNSDIQNNARGALSGQSRKSAQRALLTLEDCRIDGNTVFGVGASTQSQLNLIRCSFDGSNKTNIYKESGAIVQTDSIAEVSPSPGESPEKEKSSERQSKKSRTSRQRQEDVERVLRRFFVPRRRY